MTARLSTLDQIGFVLIAFCLGVAQLSIFLAELSFALAGIVWLVVLSREGRRLEAPAFFVPLVVYAALTLVSSAFSIDPRESFIDSRQLFLFLVVPVVARFARADRATKTIDV